MHTHADARARTHVSCTPLDLVAVGGSLPASPPMLFLRHAGDLVRIRGPLTGGRVWQEGLDTMAGCGQRTEPELAVSSLMLAYVLGCVENLLS